MAAAVISFFGAAVQQPELWQQAAPGVGSSIPFARAKQTFSVSRDPPEKGPKLVL
jgi:hypothetical protein